LIKINTFGNIPLPRTQHNAILYGDLMIVFGGQNNKGEQLNDMFTLNLKTVR